MSLQDLYKNIFNTNELATSGTAALLREVNDHPYFSLAHFFLLKHTGADDAGYNTIAAKTALHFNHPFFLHHHYIKTVNRLLKKTMSFTLIQMKPL